MIEVAGLSFCLSMFLPTRSHILPNDFHAVVASSANVKETNTKETERGECKEHRTICDDSGPAGGGLRNANIL